MIPVVLINYGSTFVLEHVIKQALKPRNDVFLLSNVGVDVEDDNFHNRNISKYHTPEIDVFCENYVNMSTNPFAVERFCFLRWFFLKEFMRQENVETCLYIDSDVLLFSNAEEEYNNKYKQYDLTITRGCAPSSSFFTRYAIDSFCDFMQETFSNKTSYYFDCLKSFFEVSQKHNLGGGVCDMTLFRHYIYDRNVGGGPGRVGEMTTIIEDSTYDHNINTKDEYYDYDGVMKNIKIENGIAYCLHEKLNRNITFNCLHFQGGAKRYLKDYYSRINEEK